MGFLQQIYLIFATFILKNTILESPGISQRVFRVARFPEYHVISQWPCF